MKSSAKTLKALGDETRLRLVTLLAHREMCVCDLTAALVLPQSTISRHLTLLKNVDLVMDRKQGVWTYYRLSGQSESAFHELVSQLARRLSDSDVARQDLRAYQEFKAGKGRPCD